MTLQCEQITYVTSTVMKSFGMVYNGDAFATSDGGNKTDSPYHHIQVLHVSLIAETYRYPYMIFTVAWMLRNAAVRCNVSSYEESLLMLSVYHPELLSSHSITKRENIRLVLTLQWYKCTKLSQRTTTITRTPFATGCFLSVPRFPHPPSRNCEIQR